MENLLPTVEAWLMEKYKDKAILPSVYMRMMRYDQLMLSQFVAELVVTQIGGLAPVLPSFNEIPRWISMRSLVRELPHVPNRYLELVGSSGQQSAGGLPLASEDNHPGGTPRTSLPGPTGRNQALAGTTGDQGPPASRVTNPIRPRRSSPATATDRRRCGSSCRSLTMHVHASPCHTWVDTRAARRTKSDCHMPFAARATPTVTASPRTVRLRKQPWRHFWQPPSTRRGGGLMLKCSLVSHRGESSHFSITLSDDSFPLSPVGTGSWSSTSTGKHHGGT